ncbi:hypothetical protein EIM48_11380 [Pseudoxanthomonas sp. SGNA-20]|uniref:hypothetical protein n=1 Tax=unclassified Pseudoxanthomonas TaxID=2645906 RepID=UPI000F62BB6A|nr:MULTISPECIES: hypothetical protein [unclassified Pseudoxanthomonas]RRN55344.1 hypothetical protein EIM48_11380 [Pseudoxanthomonas sp. SGNA-20]
MSRFRFRSPPIAAQAVLLGLLVFGLLLQPVIAAVGEIHALAHDPSGTHQHELRTGISDGEQAVPGEQGQGESETLHMFVHFAHCCGFTAALLPGVAQLSALSPAGQLMATKPVLLPSAHLSSPFKPPIYA